MKLYKLKSNNVIWVKVKYKQNNKVIIRIENLKL